MIFIFFLWGVILHAVVNKKQNAILIASSFWSCFVIYKNSAYLQKNNIIFKNIETNLLFFSQFSELA